MTGFHSLYYTDCLAGEGLLGGAGFQFRAVSPGTDPAAMELVQRACLYEPPAEWMREGRPVASFPTSLAHVCKGGRLATAAGRYLGAEVKGQRGGNHFTHAVVTDAIADFGQVRPAQLWGSSLWVDEANGQTARSPAAPPPIGPLGPEQLQRWVDGQPGGERTLLDLLSALERVRLGGERVVVVSSRAEPVLAWVAAATLLMPRPDALQVGFKVFAANAQYGEHDVIALHPDWAGFYRGAPDGCGAVVFDLDEGVHSGVEPTGAAAFWVPRFLRCDVFDVLDAVELSGVVRSSTAVGDPERTAAAALVLGERIPPGGMDPLLAWLEGGAAGLSPRRRDALFDVVLAHRPEPGQMRALSRIAAASPDRAFRDRVLWRVFGAAVAQLDGREPGEITTRRQAVDRVEQALVDADPEALVALLELAADHGVAPDTARFPRALSAFARWWAAGALDVDVDRWSCGPQVIDLLRDELSRRLAGASVALRDTTGDLWWARLWPTISDPRSPLDTVVAAAAMRHGDRAVRAGVTRAVLDALRRAGATDAMDVAWRALFSRRAPAAADLLPVLLADGANGVPSADTVGAIADVLAAESRTTPAMLDILVALAELKVDLGRPDLVKMQREVVALRGLPERLPRQDRVGGLVPTDVARELNATSSEVLAAEVPAVLQTLTRQRPEDAVSTLLSLSFDRKAMLVEELEQTVGRQCAAGPAAVAFVLMEKIVEIDKPGTKRLREVLEGSCRGLDQAARNGVAELLHDVEQRKRWFDLCGQRGRLARFRDALRPPS